MPIGYSMTEVHKHMKILSIGMRNEIAEALNKTSEPMDAFKYIACIIERSTTRPVEEKVALLQAVVAFIRKETGDSMSSVEDYIKEVNEELLRKQEGRMGSGKEAAPEAPKELEKLEVTLKEAALMAGQVKFSEVFGMTPESFIDHAVTMVPKNPDHAAHIQSVDEQYSPAVSALEDMVTGIECGDNILITGPTGSGKSSLAQFVAAKTGRPMLRVNMSGDIESSALFGGYTVEDGATVWHDGPVTEAVVKGYCLLIDEYDVMPPEVAMTLQYLLEDGGKLYIKERAGSSEDKMLTPHEDFRIIATGNTVGQGDDTASYAGTTVQNAANLDRFGTSIELTYQESSHERKMIKKRVPAMLMKDIDKMLAIADLIRTSYTQGGLGLTMSPRTLVTWAKKSVYWGCPLRSFKVAFFGKLVESDKQTVNAMLQKIYGEVL